MARSARWFLLTSSSARRFSFREATSFRGCVVYLNPVTGLELSRTGFDNQSEALGEEQQHTNTGFLTWHGNYCNFCHNRTPDNRSCGSFPQKSKACAFFGPCYSGFKMPLARARLLAALRQTLAPKRRALAKTLQSPRGTHVNAWLCSPDSCFWLSAEFHFRWKLWGGRLGNQISALLQGFRCGVLP